MIEVRVLGPADLTPRMRAWDTGFLQPWRAVPSHHPAWLLVMQRGLRHVPYCLEAVRAQATVGLLPLAYVRSVLFGRFLVGLPYLNSAGVMTRDPTVATALIDRAIGLADELDVRYLELRHETEVAHPRLSMGRAKKVHMRLALPGSPDELWRQLKAKVRNQIRKGERQGLTVGWNEPRSLDQFYSVFSHNMRDLGTPVYGRGLFRSILSNFPDTAELCVVRCDRRPVAAALLVHGEGRTEVPSASSLRRFNHTNANMLMYWHLLRRAIERGQREFDFGRSTAEGGTYRFKKQWGAQPEPAKWQFYLRKGNAGDMRPDNPKYRSLIRLWRRLPVGVTQIFGPAIVRGIP